MYKTFTRTWWRENPEWPDGLEPEAGDKQYTGNEYETEAESRAACRMHRAVNDPGRLSRKMEYEQA